MNLKCIKAPNELIPFTDSRIQWPMAGSIKYDGHRMVTLQGTKFITPSGKDHVNAFIRSHFYEFCLHLESHHLVADGELWSPALSFNELQSVVRSESKPLPDGVGYHVFDLLTYDEWEGKEQCRTYQDRYYTLANLPNFTHTFYVKQVLLRDWTDGETFYQKQLEAGHEGAMLRSPLGTYKHGRCTHLESHLLKFKNFITEDAIIVGFEPLRQMKAGIERTVGPTGHLERSFRQEDYEDVEAVGSFVVKQGDVTFKVKPGKGHTAEDRRAWWRQRATLLGTGVEFSHMPHGAKNLPRIGSLVRFRPELSADQGSSETAP